MSLYVTRDVYEYETKTSERCFTQPRDMGPPHGRKKKGEKKVGGKYVCGALCGREEFPLPFRDARHVHQMLTDSSAGSLLKRPQCGTKCSLLRSNVRKM